MNFLWLIIFSILFHLSMPQFSQEISTLLGQFSLSDGILHLLKAFNETKHHVCRLNCMLLPVHPGKCWPACNVKLKIICRIFMDSLKGTRKAACDCHCLEREFCLFFIEIFLYVRKDTKI